MTFSLKYCRSHDGSETLQLGPGDVLFVVGANGTGKSSLLQNFYQQAPVGQVRRITAHRQTWFASNTLDLTPTNKRQYEQQMARNDMQAEARWQDSYAPQRASMTIFDLIDAQNVRARAIADAVDADQFEEAQRLSAAEAPLKAINELLALSNIPVEISVQANEQIVARKSGGPTYSVAELSDGERNALLIAGDVLTAKPGSLLLIDEPERHLHRAIISPLLTLLFEKRPDCAFIVSTHELDLPLDNPSSQVLLVRSCIFEGSRAQGWDADLLDAGADIDPEAKRDIIGGRRRILFVEGTDGSRDKPLYSLLFPMVSVVAKGSCRDVEQAVAGVRSTDGLHWVSAWGIVDGDGHDAGTVAAMKGRNIFAVPFYSVESIYYHPEIIRRVARRQAAVTGDDGDSRTTCALEAALNKISSEAERLSAKRAEKIIRRRIFSNLPTAKTILAGASIEILVDTRGVLQEMTASLQESINERKWIDVVTRCSVRESQALDIIAKGTGFTGAPDYEKAVRKLLVDDGDSLAMARSLLSEVEAAVGAAG